MRSMKIMVTGGSGYIGQHLCKRLLEEGYEVTNVDTEYYSGVLWDALPGSP